jgi:putative transposase
MVKKCLSRMSGKLSCTVLRRGKGSNPFPLVDYRWPGWIERVSTYGLIRSMSKKACTPDNAACEGFFGRIKNEMFYNRSWHGVSIEEFMDYLDSYLSWYNEKRIKMSIGGLSPVRYRKQLGLAA